MRGTDRQVLGPTIHEYSLIDNDINSNLIKLIVQLQDSFWRRVILL